MEDDVHALTGERRQQTDRTKRFSTSDVYGDNDGLRQHCELVADAYNRCFVIGLLLHQMLLLIDYFLFTGLQSSLLQ